MYITFALIFGLFFGSFLNVCIYRMPLEESIVFPPSRCPKCKTKLRAHNLVPVLSYIFQGGKCAYCREKISVRYPIVELLTGIIYALIVYKFGVTSLSLSYIILSSLLIVSTFTDISHQIIPNLITIPGIIIGLALSLIFRITSPLSSFIGVLVGGGILLLVLLISLLIYRKEGMGMGDIKLAAMIGAFLGWKSVFFALIIAMILGGIIGVILIATRIKSREDYIPFGPYIVMGAFMVIFAQHEIFLLASWYMRLLHGGY